ncbi:hypothetical protein KDA_13850 [Dictyobacter alpinus]|uniref:Uncharacterized protein n=1 Tax=Dictyobacter alpinus TaxID=2014873 RepID=A0A402B3H2_9CHLR|nr:hypothetical protein KDA_13850 [Dictyobacter alpinus]
MEEDVSCESIDEKNDPYSEIHSYKKEHKNIGQRKGSSLKIRTKKEYPSGKMCRHQKGMFCAYIHKHDKKHP